ncbi:MAG: type IV toxin-antitoxin system AbiEi family antitoxin domain-containing protein [Lachnospiraceae bacterium]
MNINQTIYNEIKKNNNMITTAQVLSLGYSKQLLTNYVKEGLLERCRHGVYTFPNAVHDDMYTLMLRSDKIVFSHDTALFLNGLSERTPFMHTVTIPSNAALPNSIKGECTCFYVKPELHDIGIIEKNTTFGNTVRCYNIERTICDFLRCRNRCDEETVISAIKNYAIYDKKDLNLLSVYAKQFKVARELKKYLEVLL